MRVADYTDMEMLNANTRVSERLIEERGRLGLSQEDFAVATGLKLGTVYLVEKGKRKPNTEYLIKAKNVGVKLHYVMALSKIEMYRAFGWLLLLAAIVYVLTT